MALFNNLHLSQKLNEADNLEKVKSYLFQNNELLRYVLGNINPEDNYSADALKKYIERDGKIATLEFDSKGLQVAVKGLRTETEAQFKVTAEQISSEITRATTAEGELSSQITLNAKAISLKVNQGEVTKQLNSELKITGNTIALSTGNFTISSKNLTIDSAGNANYSGKVTAASFEGVTITGSVFKSDVFYADDEEAWLGDWYVSVDGTNVFASSDGSVSIQTKAGGPLGSYAALVLQGASGTTTVSDHHIETSETVTAGKAMLAPQVQCNYVDGYNSSNKKSSYFYDIYLGKSWWDDWSITETVQDLWEQVDSLSDARAKENVGNIEQEDAVSFLLKARPVIFQYKRDGKWSAGFIAQEVDAAMNELGIFFPIVGTDKKTGLYKVDYKTYIPLLVEVYQLLYSKVQSLEMLVEGSDINE